MLGALSELACGGDLVECEPQRVTGDGQHWAFRIVDGKLFLFSGREGLEEDFDANPAPVIAKANAEWPAVEAKEFEARSHAN